MGNNPSRAAAQHNHHNHAHQQQQQPQQSPSTSAPPSNAPTRASSSSTPRRTGYRRNSLQSPATTHYSNPTSQEFSTTARPRYQSECATAAAAADFVPPSDHHPHYHHRYHTPPPPHRRESIAETISEGGYNAFPPRTREELLQDAAALRLFPSPPLPPQPSTGSEKASAMSSGGSGKASPSLFAPGVNPFAQQSLPGGSRQPGGITSTIEGMRQGRGSVESTTASMEEDMTSPELDARAVPTLIQWQHEGTKVYITGTFCAWEKKYKLSRNPEDGTMLAIVDLPPGTHHVKFLVDGEMRTSPELPTAVDDTGILVNYLEVSADEMPPLNRQLSSDSQPGHSGVSNAASTATSERIPGSVAAGTESHQLLYTTEIPPYLREFTENYNDEDSRGGGDSPSYAADGAPPPPSLPMMLQRVILNTSSTTARDDASVLGIPNHAVLNHLATSSIKNSILAVSATTRYKKKYVTTILYKAASEE